jgi:hypothetical protein
MVLEKFSFLDKIYSIPDTFHNAKYISSIMYMFYHCRFLISLFDKLKVFIIPLSEWSLSLSNVFLPAFWICDLTSINIAIKILSETWCICTAAMFEQTFV